MLVVKVIVFVNFPILFVEYLTPIDADSPGAIGAFGQVGTVQPQLPLASTIIKSDFPVFVKVNSVSTVSHPEKGLISRFVVGTSFPCLT